MLCIRNGGLCKRAKYGNEGATNGKAKAIWFIKNFQSFERWQPVIKIEKHFFLLLVYVPILAVFKLLEKIVVPQYIMYIPVDSYIPYIKYFVIFYIIWFPYMGVSTAYFWLFSKEDFYKLTAFMSIGMAISLLIFAMFPNGQQLRPLNTGSGITGALVSIIYKIDTPTNVCPSIHVINSMAVHICIAKSKLFKRRVFLKAVSFFTMVMINLSTVFIKQHSFVDAFAGFAVVFTVYWLVFGIMFNRKLNKSVKFKALS